MIQRGCLLLIAAAVLPALPAAAQLHAGDIAVRTKDGAIQTGNIDPQNGEPNWGIRVFLGTFGEFPNFTNDPGLDSPGGAFPPGTGIGFDVLRALRIWDGEAFEDIPAELIELRKGELFLDTPLTDEVAPGFVTGEANAGGKFHHHIGFTLLDPAGDGIYLLELRLWSDAQDIAPSPPVFVVFNQNMPVEDHHDAAGWAQDNLLGDEGCPADIDGNGVLDLFDFLGFQNLFVAHDPKADLDVNGVFDLFDFLAYQNLFVAGCP